MILGLVSYPRDGACFAGNLKPLTILNISQNYHIRGGSDKIFLALGELLRSKGHQVIPLAAKSPDNLATEWDRFFPHAAKFEKPGPMDLLRFIYSLPAKRAVRRVIEEFHPDIAHLHIYYGKITASILAELKGAGLPVVQTLHEYKLICPVYTLISNGQICEACEGAHFWRALPRRCNRGSLARTALSVLESYVSHWLGAVDKVDKFIAVSDALRGKMIQHGIPPEKIITLRNWVDCDNVQPSRQVGEYFLYFGRIERLKGIFSLIEAAAKIPANPLLIVGEGEAKEELVKLIRSKGYTHIKWLGFKKGAELQDLIRRSICTVIPSEWFEPFPMTVLESFSHARPAIGASIGGIPEIIEHGIDGFIFEPGDVDMLASYLTWMAEHPDQAVAMGSAGRNKVQERFSPDKYYQDLMNIYNSVL